MTTIPTALITLDRPADWMPLPVPDLRIERCYWCGRPGCQWCPANCCTDPDNPDCQCHACAAVYAAEDAAEAVTA